MEIGSAEKYSGCSASPAWHCSSCHYCHSGGCPDCMQRPGAAVLASFLYPLYSYAMFSPRGGNMQQKFYDLILDHVEKNSAGKCLTSHGQRDPGDQRAMRYPAAQ